MIEQKIMHKSAFRYISPLFFSALLCAPIEGTFHDGEEWESYEQDYWDEANGSLIAQSEFDAERSTSPGQMQGDSSGVNPAALPAVHSGDNVWIQGEGLYWKANEENLYYALLNLNPPSGGQPPQHYSLQRATLDWNEGFRVSIGYMIPHGKWDLSLYWTSICNQGSNTVHGTLPPGNAVDINQMIGYQNTMTGRITRASARSKIDFDQVDLQLGKEFGVSRYLKLRPIAGLRSTWIDQSVHADYFEFFSQTTSKHKIDWDFWGFGFLAGLQADWMLSRDWSIFSLADYSILWGFFDIDQKQRSNPPRRYKFEESFRCARSVFDIALGLKWSHLFHNQRWRLSFKGAYEYHLYPQQNQLLYNTNCVILNSNDNGSFINNPGDLVYQGVSFSAQIDF